VHQGLPVIVVRNAWTMPQERYNADWIEEHQAGLVLDSFKSIRGGVEQLTARSAEYRANVRRIHNRAVFEIPQILAEILSRSPIRIGVDLLQHFRPAERLHLS
jgi:1,2-diacylglycerol 3-beta-galactosyltransferase